LNIQQIKKAFTLVELIVVITILAILATIAFISFQGSTTEANNTKVMSDVRNLVSKISIMNGMWTSIKDLFLVWSSTNKPDSLVVFWWKTPISYDVWKINFWNLQESSDAFQDKKEEPWKDYLFWYAFWWNSNWWALNNYSYFQVAGQLINNNWWKTVVIKWNYTPMVWTDSSSLITEKTDNTVFLTNDGDATNMY